jgi:sulfite reductase (NADPH) flavoprotein alpha-component
VAGTVALVLGLTGAVLLAGPGALPWQARPTPNSLSVASWPQIAASVPGAEEVRRLPSGEIVVYGFDNGQARASRIDPASGQVLGEYQPSATMRWFKNLHRSFLLGDGGRIAAALVALAMGCSPPPAWCCWRGAWAAGAVARPRARHAGAAPARGHRARGAGGAAAHLGHGAGHERGHLRLVTLDADAEPDRAPSTAITADLPAAHCRCCASCRCASCEAQLPRRRRPADTWQVTTTQGQGWIDRHSGQTLAWQDASTAQRINDWAVLLHTGEGAWAWAPVLGLAGLPSRCSGPPA